MKKVSSVFRKMPVLLLGLVMLGFSGNAQTYTESRKIIRSFPVFPETRLDITNKYGKIHVIQWKKDSVRIEVDLFVRSSSTGKLEKILDNIDFEFTGTNYYIIANTRFDNAYNAFFSDLRDLSGNIIPSKNQVEINYTVMMPSSMNINLSNKFGDIYIDDLKGSVTVSLSNGDMKINRLDGQSNLNLNFSNAIVNYLSNAKITLVFADLEIKNAGQLSIESKASKIRINNINILKTQSGRDKYMISEVNNLFGESYFSDIWIYRLNEEVNYSPKYGDFKIDSVSRDFSYINLHSEYTDINIFFNQASSYYLEVDHHPDVNLRIPDDIDNLEKVVESPDETHISGNIGKGSFTSRVEITAPKKCIVSLNTRRDYGGN